jgi:hypothetical protein
MRECADVEIVRFRVLTTPRLLADSIAAALDTPELRPWLPGDSPALVTITNAAAIIDVDMPPVLDSRVTIVVPDRLGDRVPVKVDGQWSVAQPTYPHALHDLVLTLVRELSTSDADGSSAGSSSNCSRLNSEPTAPRI